MKGKKIITVLIIINLILVGTIYNLINKENVNNKKQIIKEMTEAEYEDNITSLNQSHINYANYIEESKTKIASAITDMGVETSNEATPETMSSNIRSIARDASSINYNNTNSELTSTNLQEAVDELDNEIEELNNSLGNNLVIPNYLDVIESKDNISVTGDVVMRLLYEAKQNCFIVVGSYFSTTSESAQIVMGFNDIWSERVFARYGGSGNSYKQNSFFMKKGDKLYVGANTVNATIGYKVYSVD